MSAVLRVFTEEWRYWFRSRLAITATMLLLLVVATAVVSTLSRMQMEKASRQSMQTAAEEAFLAQPDRHPHRMVHYGHYVFRAPSPLATVDPGVDPLTGTVMFLEGHKQNSATFPAAYTAPQVAGLQYLTPAFTYQILVPLVLIVVGFATVARERELRTDVQLIAQGVSPLKIWAGKSLALVALGGLLLIPLAASALLTISQGESLLSVAAFIGGYLIYLAFWAFAVVGISARVKTAAMSLLWCAVAWMVFAIVVPRVASDVAGTLTPVTGKIKSDLDLIEAMRAVGGDGHNQADPAFDSLRAEVMNQYGVDRPEDLPINIRGIIAEAAEASLTDVLNEFAENRMREEAQQAQVLRRGALLSPMLAIRNLSMQASGSDLSNYHRFEREAERARFDFVQGLNRAHTTELSYVDDINRSNDAASERRTRISADNWRVLQSFDFGPGPAAERVRAAIPGFLLLLLWSSGAALFSYTGVRNTEGRYHAK